MKMHLLLSMTALLVLSVENCPADDSSSAEFSEFSVTADGQNHTIRVPRGFEVVRHSEYAPGFDECMRKTTVRYDCVKCYEDARNFLMNRLKTSFHRAKKACSDEACVNSLVKLQKTWLDSKNQTADFLKKYVAIYGYTSEIPFVYELDTLVQQNKVLNTIGESLEGFAQ